MRRARRTTGEIYPLVERYLQGSTRVRAFCAEHGISAAQLTYWRRKYQAEDGGGALEEIEAPTSEGQPLMEVTYPGGVRLRLYTPVSSAFLLPLLRQA